MLSEGLRVLKPRRLIGLAMDDAVVESETTGIDTRVDDRAELGMDYAWEHYNNRLCIAYCLLISHQPCEGYLFYLPCT